MKLVKLTTKKDFIKLKIGDFILVKWSDFFVKHHENSHKIMSYSVYENKIRSDEIICKIKGNHYFNWKMYLGLDTIGVNTSQALTVYKIVENKE